MDERRNINRLYRPRRIARILTVTFPALYLLIVLLMWANQERFIFAGHASQGTEWSRVVPAANLALIPLKTKIGDSVFLAIQKAMDAQGKSARDDSYSCPTILFFYGGGGTIAGSLRELPQWQSMGANVVLVEYPGYGMSSGISSEASLYAAADAAYQYLLSRSDVDHKKLIIAGQSLGSGVAVDLASRESVAALILFSPYTSVIAMAHKEYPWLPTSLMIRHKFQSDIKIQNVSAPILIIHGYADRVIPIQMGRDLVAAARKADVTTLFVSADHNDLFKMAGDEIDRAIQSLINRVNQSP